MSLFRMRRHEKRQKNKTKQKQQETNTATSEGSQIWVGSVPVRPLCDKSLFQGELESYLGNRELQKQEKTRANKNKHKPTYRFCNEVNLDSCDGTVPLKLFTDNSLGKKEVK